jgi:hypothetical protein
VIKALKVTMIVYAVIGILFGIVFAILMLASELYSVIMGYLAFGQAVTAIILHGIIAVALLAFYPWRAARST